MMGMLPSTPTKTHPSLAISCQCALLHTRAVLQDLPLLLGLWQEKDLELVNFCVSQPLCFLYLLEPGSSRKALLCCFGPAPAGVTSLFWKGLFHMRTFTQYLMYLGVGGVLWLCWLPLDLAERPNLVTSKGLSLPKM